MKKFSDVKAFVKRKRTEIRGKRTLRSYVFMYFIFFAVFILVLLWLFQYFFLDRYYQSAKIREVQKSAKKIVEEYDGDDIETLSRQLAFDNGLCIVIVDKTGTQQLLENNMGSFSYFSTDLKDNYGMFLYSLRSELNRSDEGFITKIHQNDNFKSQEIFYCTSFTDEDGETLYLYIESSVAPIDSTVSIIREQLVYITIILFELAFIITLFISKRLSKPIADLTKSAKKMESGDFSEEFTATGYKEIEELSSVLNDAQKEIRKVSDLRTDLIANISHDLRTPLTMVKAYAEMIRDLSGDNPVKRNEHIQIIIDEADRLSNLVNNILELSKLESGNMELEMRDFSVHEKIRDVLTRYTLLIENDGYDIQFIPDEDRIIRADPDKLDQVLYNFINNAVNYSGEDKRIRIIQINKPQAVRIEITDHGKGISKELLPLIFDRYYRDAKYKRDVVGTGLGLSICKEILKKHDFAFGVQSEEGKGSTFWFEASIATPKHSDKHHKDAKPANYLPAQDVTNTDATENK